MLDFSHRISQTQEKILELAKSYGGERIERNVKESINSKEESQLKEELRALTQKLNTEMKRLNTDVSFKYDDTLKGLLVTVKEDQSEKVIREIPSKEAIELMKKMRDLVGAIFDKRG